MTCDITEALAVLRDAGHLGDAATRSADPSPPALGAGARHGRWAAGLNRA
ncbi:MAG TPA: hypothetical protein VGA70_00730 [Longimicrobiales bacterium]|jgi:hypothetical protein